MANIAISEIATEATSLNDNDLLLVSKNDGTSFTSAKLKAGVLNKFSKLKIIDDYPKVYISPNGSDSNADLQFSNYDTENQKNYPLFTIIAACAFLARFYSTKQQKVSYIYCKNGTYNYTSAQTVRGNYNGYGNYINIVAENEETSSVIFSFTDCSIGFDIFTNCSIRKLSITRTGSYPDTINLYGINVRHGAEVSVYGCTIHHWGIGIHIGGYTLIRSWYKNRGTLDTIENNHTPTYIYDCLYGIWLTSDSSCDINDCWLRINTTYEPVRYVSGRSLSLGYIVNGGNDDITRLDLKRKTSGKVLFSIEASSYASSYNSLLLTVGDTNRYQMNCKSVTQYDVNEYDSIFTLVPNSVEYNPSGRVSIGGNYKSCINLNVDKF